MDGRRHEDLLWSYVTALPEAQQVVGYWSVDDGQDGVVIEVTGP